MRRYPILHLVSDVHLEGGAYRWPDKLDFDIAIAAGDIGPLEVSIPFLAALNKPVVYVLGNHEFYGRAIDKVAAQAKALAQGTQVHVLDNESIELMGVRFFGCTLWTSLCDGHPMMIRRALAGMNDFREIGMGDFLTDPTHPERYVQFLQAMETLKLPVPLDNRGREVLPNQFHPVAEYLLHRQSVMWLQHELSQIAPSQAAVVVSHHPPSYACLRAVGVQDAQLDPAGWDALAQQPIALRVAAYASHLDGLLQEHSERIALWCHGHVHVRQDLAIQGVRVCSNPRGYPPGMLDLRSIEEYASMGIEISLDDVLASQAAHHKNPNIGDGRGFDERWTIDLRDGLQPSLQRVLDSRLPEMMLLLEQAHNLLPYTRRGCALQRQSVLESVHQRAQRFCERLDMLDAQVLHQLMPQSIEQRTWDDLRTLNLPDLPVAYLQGDVLTPSARETVQRMRAWVRVLSTWSDSAKRHRARWRRAANQALAAARACGIEATLEAPVFRAWRHVDVRRIVLHLATGIDAEQREALARRIDEALGPGHPWWIVLREPALEELAAPSASARALAEV